MRLVEYLFQDPGTPPTPDHGENPSDFIPFNEYGNRMGGPEVNATPRIGDPIAHLDGGPYYLRYGYSPLDAIYYRHVLGESTGHSVQSAVVKSSANEGRKLEHGSYDNRAIGKLKTGKYPGRAEDGKGFCFVCSNGALHAFRWRGDAMRWANDEPREITKFWYGEPISPSGKFRIRVRDRYRKDEAVGDTLTAFLERRAERTG